MDRLLLSVQLFVQHSAVGPSTTPTTHTELHSPYPLCRSDTCLLRSPVAVCFRQVGTPDASFRLAATLRLAAVPGTHIWKQVASASDCTTLGATLGSRLCAALRTDCTAAEQRIVRSIANGLHDRSAAYRARHCTQIARRKSGGLRA